MLQVNVRIVMELKNVECAMARALSIRQTEFGNLKHVQHVAEQVYARLVMSHVVSVDWEARHLVLVTVIKG